jgi:hypothetical protein
MFEFRSWLLQFPSSFFSEALRSPGLQLEAEDKDPGPPQVKWCVDKK